MQLVAGTTNGFQRVVFAQTSPGGYCTRRKHSTPATTWLALTPVGLGVLEFQPGPGPASPNDHTAVSHGGVK